MTMTDQTTGLPAPSRTGRVPIERIDRDERVNTRPIDEAWVSARVPKFRPEALGVPAVSLRADGTYIVLDGQNRVALCRACEWGHDLLCEIYEGLDLAQEAGLFVLLNDSRAVRPGHRFRARVTQNDPTACAILETAKRAGWEIGLTPASGVITAITTLEKIWEADLRRNPGEPPSALALTLQTITKAWQHTPNAQHQAIIAGIGALFVKHGLAIDPDRLASQLAGYEGGPSELVAQARGLARYHGGSVANSVADLVTTEYNRGLQTRRLPKFR